MKNYRFSLLALGLLAFSACEKTKQQFDFSKKPPDEFQITTRAPLEMPPDYNLRPPRPGAPRPQEETAVEEAKQAVFGPETTATEQQAQPESVSQGEAILLQKTGVTAIDPNIRDKVDMEAEKLKEEETPTFDRLFGKVTGKRVEAPADVVDPVKESERIITNKEQGKPITDGQTPTVED
jgi:hypothetical protein